jgi:hypothetical protein
MNDPQIEWAYDDRPREPATVTIRDAATGRVLAAGREGEPIDLPDEANGAPLDIQFTEGEPLTAGGGGHPKDTT